MTLIACPGQGSQTPGFLSRWLEIPVFSDVIHNLQDFLQLDLIRLGTLAEIEEIKDTKVAQPLIVAAGIASFRVLQDVAGKKLEISGVAGHSVGEITAAHVAGILDAKSAMDFVKLRGEQMAEAAKLQSTSMAAVVGGDESEILDAIESAGLVAANFNGPGQIVAAGKRELIEKLIESPPAGARVVLLQVAGAFHTTFMASAQAKLLEFSSGLNPKDPEMTIWTNRDGSIVTRGDDFLKGLVGQVTSPVRWDLTMNGMLDSKENRLIELLPGGTLAGIAKRAMPGVSAVALKTPADLDKAIQLLKE